MVSMVFLTVFLPLLSIKLQSRSSARSILQNYQNLCRAVVGDVKKTQLLTVEWNRLLSSPSPFQTIRYR